MRGRKGGEARDEGEPGMKYGKGRRDRRRRTTGRGGASRYDNQTSSEENEAAWIGRWECGECGWMFNSMRSWRAVGRNIGEGKLSGLWWEHRGVYKSRKDQRGSRRLDSGGHEVDPDARANGDRIGALVTWRWARLLCLTEVSTVMPPLRPYSTDGATFKRSGRMDNLRLPSGRVSLQILAEALPLRIILFFMNG